MRKGELVQRAKEQIEELTGRRAESVSALERADDGWRVSLELVELARIPSSTDVLATYELLLDADGEVVGYSRGRRYHRSQAGGEEDGE
ncbi:MAG: gas vesicle protein [Thermoleophilia bacterium]|nr:gas vesicle protein [Thermoleophilia bacterium]